MSKSKPVPPSYYDPETATLLAVSRALRKLAGQMDKAARARVKSADSTRQDRERSRARKQVAGTLQHGYLPRHARAEDEPDGHRESLAGEDRGSGE